MPKSQSKRKQTSHRKKVSSSTKRGLRKPPHVDTPQPITTQAVEETVNLLINSTALTDITAYLTEKHPKTDAGKVIDEAIQQIRRAADFDETYERGKTRLRYEMLYQQAQKIKDINAALKTTIAENNFITKTTTVAESKNETEELIRNQFERIIQAENLPLQELLRRVTLLISKLLQNTLLPLFFKHQRSLKKSKKYLLLRNYTET